MKIVFSTVIVLIFILLVTIISGYALRDYEQSKQNILLSELEIQDIIMTTEVDQDLQDLWEENTDEFVACLLGHLDGDQLYVNGLILPEETFFTSEDDLIVGGCKDVSVLGFLEEKFSSDRVVGTIHNHRSGICFLSDKDQYVFGKLNDVTMGVMCEIDRYAFYQPNSFLITIPVTVE